MPLGKPLGLYLCLYLYLYLYLWLYLYLYLHVYLYLYLYLLTRELSACGRTFLLTGDHICLRDLASRIVNFTVPQSLLGSFFFAPKCALPSWGLQRAYPPRPVFEASEDTPPSPPLELLLGAFQGLLGSL